MVTMVTWPLVHVLILHLVLLVPTIGPAAPAFVDGARAELETELLSHKGGAPHQLDREGHRLGVFEGDESERLLFAITHWDLHTFDWARL